MDAGTMTMDSGTMDSGTPPPSSSFTLIQVGDMHGQLVGHGEELYLNDTDTTPTYDANAGGLARLKTVIDSVRTSATNHATVMVGDLTHGSAETLFTVGDAIMPAVNMLALDAFIPGNWDFGYGPAVFRRRFATSMPQPPLPENAAYMASVYDGADVTKATFDSVAVNLYNDTPAGPAAAFHNNRVLPPYKIVTLGDQQVAIVGMTASIVPQQSRVFNLGLRFTQGVEELAGVIADAKTAGADFIVVGSELGLSQNLQIARDFDVDVVFSAHTHELTRGAILVTPTKTKATTPGAALNAEEQQMLADGAAIVTEITGSEYVGRLDITVTGGAISTFTWKPIPVVGSTAEDATVKMAVDDAEEPFIAGTDATVVPHYFMPGGYCTSGTNCATEVGAKKGLILSEDLDTVVGRLSVDVDRHQVVEEPWNDVIADAMYEVMNAALSDLGEPAADVAMTNGFRFGIHVPAGDDITLRVLYSHFPIGAGVSIADFSGEALLQDLENVLSKVFNRNPYQQAGGWNVAMGADYATGSVKQDIDLTNGPFGSSGGYIISLTINGNPINRSKRYRMVSCYPHGDPNGHVCRSTGGANMQFFALQAPYAWDSGNAPLENPAANGGNGPVITAGPTINQNGPDHFMHPVHVMRRFFNLHNGGDPATLVDISTFAPMGINTNRIRNIDATLPAADRTDLPDPVSAIDPSFVQPPEGAGPWLVPFNVHR